MIYWDTSCVLKLYCRERDSDVYLRRVQVAEEPLCTSILAATELVFAFRQKELRGEIRKGLAARLDEKFRSDVQAGRFTLLPLGDDIREEARRIAMLCYAQKPPVPLHTLDGLHLASAMVFSCSGILTTDARMRSASAVLGLKVEVVS